MSPLETMTDEELRSHAFSILGRELGPYGLARFISVTYPGSGDYTRDRHLWLDEKADVSGSQSHTQAA